MRAMRIRRVMLMKGVASEASNGWRPAQSQCRISGLQFSFECPQEEVLRSSSFSSRIQE